MYKFAYRCLSCNALFYMATAHCRSNVCASCRKHTLKRSPNEDRVELKEGKIKVVTSSILLPVLYNKADLPKGIDPDEQNKLVDTAFNTGWRVRFHKIFTYKNVLYERYIFEKEVK